MSVFQIGEGFVLLLAALRSIPTGLLRGRLASTAPGRWQLFRHVTLPLLAPWLLLLTSATSWSPRRTLSPPPI